MTPDAHDLGGRMLGSFADEGHADLVVQRLPLGAPLPVRPLYWCGTGEVVMNATGLRLAPGSTISTETYFGALFELPWRLYTAAGAFSLNLQLEGRATLRLWRRLPDATAVLLAEQQLDGDATIPVAYDTTHFRQAGYLWFELTAADQPAHLMAVTWTTPCSVPRCRLGVLICTFNREGPLAAVLDAAARVIPDAVSRVIVVNQGAAGLHRHPGIAPVADALGDRLRIVDQPNFGGAGGFGRAILEALDDTAISHVCLLDDDVWLEPDCLTRMAAFFTLAKDDVALGGHMLDAVRPTRLYEAGARVASNWVLHPLKHGLDLAAPDTLVNLLDVTPMHFNGWWMFGFDKRLIERAGMPLPCFIRGDDVEFGLRLHNQGVATVQLPGVGIWHEPFYLKIGGWQLYYETRNALMAAALHQHFGPRHVAVQIVKRLLIHLLTYRYYNAALVVQAARDALAGPAILDCDPRPLHAGLAALRTRYPEEWTPREQVLPKAPVGAAPHRRAGFVVAMLLALVRNGLSATPRRQEPGRQEPPRLEPGRLEVRNLVWFRVTGSDALAVDTYWDRHLPTYRRDRAAFRELLRDGLGGAWRLYRAAPGLRTAWQDDAPRLTSVAFWKGYLARRP